jgi:hypothetical protein
MQVSDLTGRVVYEQGMMVGARGATSVDLSGAVLPGQYLVRLLVPGGTSVRRLVIQR